MDFEAMSLKRKFLHGLEPNNVHMMIGIYKAKMPCFLTHFYKFNNKKKCIIDLMENFAIFLLNQGSMTIDCLGMLTELSDCERKLFPIGYQ